MKRSSTILILTGVIVVLAAALVGVLIFIKNQPPSERGIPPITEIEPMEPEFGKMGRQLPQPIFHPAEDGDQ